MSSAGRPVRLRDKGHGNDINALNRLRTALRINRKLDREKAQRAIVAVDSLIDALAALDEGDTAAA